MKFTLVITTFNSQKYIESAIQSVLNQLRRPDELIICDDNSSDNTIDICKKYKSELEIHINRNGPSGYTNAYNYAFKLGTGDYISVLHYDDLLHPEFFSKCELAFLKHPDCKFLVSRNFYFKNDVYDFIKVPRNAEIFVRIKGGDYAKSYLNGVRLNQHINRCPGTVIHRNLTSQIDFRHGAGLISDDDLFYRVGKFTDILRFTEPLAGVRTHLESESARMDPLRISNALAQGYAFMVKDWNNESILGLEGLEFFLRNFFRYNFRTLYWSSINKRSSEFNSSIELNQEINRIYSSQSGKFSKLYHKMFFFIADKRLIYLAKGFFLLHNLISNWRRRYL
jgi:glycosyltransferase involved in cell wall biosynthesis